MKEILLALLLASAAAAPLRAQGVSAPPAPGPAQPDLQLETLDLDKALREVRLSTEGETALYRAAAREYERRGQPQKALGLLAGYERSRGSDLALTGYYASLCEGAGLVDRALAAREKISARDPEEHFEANNRQLTELYLRGGKPEKAATLAGRLAGRDPGNPELQRLHASALSRAGDPKAEAVLKKLIAASPSCRDHELLYTFYLGQSKPEEAEKLIETAYTKLPALRVCLGVQRAALHLYKGENEKAEGLLKALRGKAPDPELNKHIERQLERLIKMKPGTQSGRTGL